MTCPGLKTKASERKKTMQDKPPIFKTWNSWYIMVIAFLLLLIACFYFFTQHFS